MRNPMREWIETEWGAQVVAWNCPCGEAETAYEVILDGHYIRADSVPLLIAALNECRIARFKRLNGAHLRLVA